MIVDEPPAQTAAGDAVADNDLGRVAFTVTTVVAGVPHPVAYDIVVVPAATPVTMPVLLPTVAVPADELLHVPPDVVLDKDVVEPTHTMLVPEIAAGDPFTVTVANEAPQPLL